MSAPTALDSARTGTPDGTGGIKISTIISQEDGTIEVPGGVALSDRIPSGVSPDRNDATGVDTATTDMSTVGFAGTSGANLLSINNRGALVVWLTFASNTDSVSIQIIYYDAANTPIFVGPVLSFVPETERISSAGHYMSQPKIVETYGASKYRPYITAKGNASIVDIFAQPI